MAGSEQDLNAILQNVVVALHTITSFIYVVTMRTGEYFSTLNSQLKGQTGGQGLDIVLPFLPMLFLIIAVILLWTFISWFFSNYELDLG